MIKINNNLNKNFSKIKNYLNLNFNNSFNNKISKILYNLIKIVQ